MGKISRVKGWFKELSIKCRPFFWVFFAGVLIVTLWLQTPCFVLKFAELYYGETPPFEVRGQFGDLYGATNALFSGLAFLGLIASIQLQRRDLAINTLALKDSQREMENTNRWLGRQTELSMATSQLEALRILIRQQKARLHTHAPRYFLDPDTVDYSPEAIERFEADLNLNSQACMTQKMRAQNGGRQPPLCGHPQKEDILQAIRMLKLYTTQLLVAFRNLGINSSDSE